MEKQDIIPVNENREVLYHYTSQAGLLGVIKEKAIWATNIYYLNDSMEYQYALDIIREVINSYLEQLYIKRPDIDAIGQEKGTAVIPEDKIKTCEQLETLWEVLSVLKTYHVYICSFSSEGDQLSQWRGYCPEGSGFSIGFEKSWLISKMKEQGFNLCECIYKKEKQIQALCKIIDEFLVTFEKRDVAYGEEWNKIMLVTVVQLILAIPTIKHEAFHEEKEWRFVLNWGLTEKKPIEYRQGKSMVIPYISVPLLSGEEPIKIDNIIIGPTPHRLLSQKSIESLLKSNNIKCVTKLSNVPYRVW